MIESACEVEVAVQPHFVIMGTDLEYLLRFRSELLEAIADRGYRVTAATPSTRTDVPSALRDVGVSFATIPLRPTGTNPTRDTRDVLAMARWLRSIEPDVVFAYGAKPIAYGLLAARLAGVRERFAMLPGLGYAFIDDGRRSVGRSAIRSILTALYRFTLPHCRNVIFQNDDDRSEFVRRRIVDATRTVVVNGSGVNLDHFRASPVPTDPPRFLFVGRLLRSKGVHEYVEAASLVRRHLPEAEFHVVGAEDMNPDRANASLLRASAESNDIVLHGQVQDVRPWLATCSAFVLPSYREGLPRSALEAMACGRTTIVADTPGCRNVVRPGRHGALVRPRDASDLARVLLEYARDPDRLRTEGAAARVTAERDYDVRHINEVMLNALGVSH